MSNLYQLLSHHNHEIVEEISDNLSFNERSALLTVYPHLVKHPCYLNFKKCQNCLRWIHIHDPNTWKVVSLRVTVGYECYDCNQHYFNDLEALCV